VRNAGRARLLLYPAPPRAMDTQRWQDEQRRLREALRAGRLPARRPDRVDPDIEIPTEDLSPPNLLTTPIVSQRGMLGRLIIGAKTVLRRLLGPFVLEPQTQFNQAVAMALAEQRELLVTLFAQVSPAEANKPGPATGKMDYLGFEERFRGSSDAIGARQTEYLDYFHDRGEILDIGCGRGEFLSMLQERGTPARGVDLDEDMVARCREQGLIAECCDAIDYLKRQPDDSFGGVFMSQLVEHLTTDYLVALLETIGRKTSKGAVLIAETINPESLPVLMRWYWLDPTHVRLVHPETLQFQFEQAGFAVKTVQFRRPVPVDEQLPSLELPNLSPEQLSAYNDAVKGLNARLFAPLDYFVVAQSK
jgi:SAM-dependent methyltransferase